MPSRTIPSISLRKAPCQERSSRLVADILEAAIRVLTEGGAHRFTTARVAEKAGVSVGSLYQYFPNKEAILFRLQTDEWERTSLMLREILTDRSHSTTERVHKLISTFFQTECDEAAFRLALEDAAPLYRDAPEAQALRKRGLRQITAFLREAVPALSPRKRALAADMMMITIGAGGEHVSAQTRSPHQVAALAGQMGDMICAYLDVLARSSNSP